MNQQGLQILDKLIKEGNDLKSGIRYIPPHSGVIRTFNVYKHDNNEAYQNWISLCKRFINSYSKDDISEFDQLTKKISPDNHTKMLSILIAIKDFTEIKNEHILESTPNIQTNKIFIVHGHSEAMKQSVARLLQQLKLEPIILHEMPNQGKTLIEKFEENSNEIGFAIILLTADDKGKSNSEKSYKSRARQNVIFEMGYFIGKLGRDRVFLLLDNDVEKPSDLDGIVYTASDSAGAWKYTLGKELISAGYSITLNDI